MLSAFGVRLHHIQRTVGLQQLWDCDDLAGLPRIEPGPHWDRRWAFNPAQELGLILRKAFFDTYPVISELAPA